jgi:hypothetical protein
MLSERIPVAECQLCITDLTATRIATEAELEGQRLPKASDKES